jgi:hypothetical protein
VYVFYRSIQKKAQFVYSAWIMVDGANIAEMPFIGTSSMYLCQGMCHRLDATESNFVCIFVIIIALPLHMYIWACDSLLFNIFTLCNITSVLLWLKTCPACYSRLIISWHTYSCNFLKCSMFYGLVCSSDSVPTCISNIFHLFPKMPAMCWIDWHVDGCVFNLQIMHFHW